MFSDHSVGSLGCGFNSQRRRTVAWQCFCLLDIVVTGRSVLLINKSVFILRWLACWKLLETALTATTKQRFCSLLSLLEKAIQVLNFAASVLEVASNRLL